MNSQDIFRLRARVGVFTSERVGHARCLAVVEEMTTEQVVLAFDPADLSEVGLRPGDALQLGFGCPDRRMYFTCDSQVLRIDGRKVAVATPQPLQKRPRRAHARAPLEWPCLLDVPVPDGLTALQGTTVDVSASGALIAVDQAPAPRFAALGDTVRAVLRPPERPPFACMAEVVRHSSRAIAGVERMTIAVRYLDLPEIAEVKLQLLVLRAIARRYLRCRVELAARLELGDGDQRVVFDGVSENLSGSGTLLRVPLVAGQAPARGRRGRLELALPGGPVAIATVEIARCEARDDESAAVAINYVAIGHEQRSAIVELVMERVRDV